MAESKIIADENQFPLQHGNGHALDELLRGELRDFRGERQHQNSLDSLLAHQRATLL